MPPQLDIIRRYFFHRMHMESVTEIESNLTNTNVSVNATDFLTYPSVMYFSIGSLMSLIMVVGFTTNLTILYTYATNRKIRTVDNTLIIGLALSDIGQSVFGIPFVTISSFSKRWIFGHAFCQYYAFITTSFGIAQICMLTVIAVERYFVIVRRDRRLTSTTFRCVIIIVCSFIYGSAWATGPLLGWSGYKEEDIGIACCVKWEVKDRTAISYTISLCTFGWFIPLFLIAFGYISIVCSIYNEGHKRLYLRRQVTPNKTSRERKVAFTVLIMIGAFIVSWTPYSAVSLWSAVGDFHTIPMWVQVAPAVFAKCSIIWNPLIYVARHKHFRQGVKQSLSSLKFWNRGLVRISNVVINRPTIGGQHLHTANETSSQKHHEKQSIISDHFVTHIDDPGRSNTSSSVFLKGPPSLKRPRLTRQITFNSTLDSSQQIDEQNEYDYAGAIRNYVILESKQTQTESDCADLPSILQTEVSDKFVQTIVSGPIRCDEESTPHADTPSDSTIAAGISPHISDPTITHAANLSILNDMPKRQIGFDKESASVLTYPENKSEASETNIKLAKTRSLEALKEKRNILRKQLKIIYKDNGTVDVLPERSEYRQITEFREFPETHLQMNKSAMENDTQRQNVTYTRTRSKYAKPSIHSKSITNTSIVQGRCVSPRYIRHLQPYHLQKLERYKEKVNRQRIISDPTSVEMRTYSVKLTDRESKSKYDSERTGYPTVAKASFLRQSTV